MRAPERRHQYGSLPAGALNAVAPACAARHRGQGRVSADDILATIKLRKGVPCTDGEVTRDVRALWDMGYFANVEVDAKTKDSGVELVFRVKERPAIGEVIYEGLDEIEQSDLDEKVTLA